ncbi:MAG: cobalamin B12-binding domain-containing protein [Candidatus Thorarchaeota archaeon]|jgi:methylmalonyl-CoA mutase cobalamin-binding domain/chain
MLVELDIDAIADATQKELDAGSDPQVIMQALTEGMNEVGKRYEEGEYFLTELVLAGETMKEAFAIVKPHLAVEEEGERKPVIVATVKGDNHDIGKNILGTMLVSAGFDVIDLGIDVSKETIIEEVKKHDVKVVALSCLLTMTINEISLVNEALKEAGLRDKVKLVVGGAPLSMELAKELGADDYGADAIDGVKRIGALLGE